MQNPDYASRRFKFIDNLPINSACLVLSNETLFKNSDTEFSFRQDSNFWYLTGIDEPDSALLIIKSEDSFETSIFVREKIKAQEIWNGYRLGMDEAKKQVQADYAYKFEDLNLQIQKIPRNISKFYFKPHSNNYHLLRQQILQDYPKRFIFELVDPDILLGEMRLIKDDIEIQYMKRAAQISIDAHRSCKKYIKESFFEYQVQAELEHIFKLNNANPAYPSIVASGDNATILHYVQNDREMKAGDLVLIDAACEYQYYSSDITRTYSTDDKYTDTQQQIYDIVLKAHQQAIAEAAIKDKTFKDVHNRAVEVLVKGLINLNLLSGSLESNISERKYQKYFMHSTSHWLGLDTHDIGSVFEPNSNLYRTLKPNMVLTIEPGLYFDPYEESIPKHFRGIGIRLEDDILITQNGIENLTANLEI